MAKKIPLPQPSARDVKARCLCLAAQRAARALARRFDAAFAPLDLTNGQYSLLMSLNRPEPPVMREVADLLAMDRTTLTAMLKPLERRGLAKARVDKADRRARRLVLTGAGKALLAKAYPIWERTLAGIEREVPDADRLRSDLWAVA